MTDITLSPAACGHLAKELAKVEQPWFRLSLREAGCSGLEYVWQPVAEPQADDLIVETDHDGLRVCVDAADYQRALRGLAIDFEHDLLSSALTYRNPNQSGTCGCGISFTVG